MTTKEMIEYLELNKLSKGISKQDDEMIVAIIKTLQHYDTLCTKIEQLLDFTNNLFIISRK